MCSLISCFDLEIHLVTRFSKNKNQMPQKRRVLEEKFSSSTGMLDAHGIRTHGDTGYNHAGSAPDFKMNKVVSILNSSHASHATRLTLPYKETRS